MKATEKIFETLKIVSIEELKKIAIAYKNDITIEGITIAYKIHDILRSKMTAGEFAEFAENELF